MRKKSGKRAAVSFKNELAEIESYLTVINSSGLSDRHVSWVYEYAVLRTYREFEQMILNCLIAAINNDTKELSQTTGISFPKHLTDEICEYLIIGDGYFDFRGRDGLIKTLRKFLSETHYLVIILKDKSYKDTLDQLSALRNFAAHNSRISKTRARDAVGMQRMESAGSWLKKQGRFQGLASKLRQIANEIEAKAPF